MIDRDKLAALHERATKGWLEVRNSVICQCDEFNVPRPIFVIWKDNDQGAIDGELIALLCSESARAEILAMMDERDMLREALRALVAAVCYADPPKRFNDVLCHEARVPVEFTADARAALGE